MTDFYTELLNFGINSGEYYCVHILGPALKPKYHNGFTQVDVKIVVPTARKKELKDYFMKFARDFWSDDYNNRAIGDDYYCFFYQFDFRGSLLAVPFDRYYNEGYNAQEYHAISVSEEWIVPEMWIYAEAEENEKYEQEEEMKND